MNLSDLLDLGIVARLDDDCGLLLDAPEGVLTDELIERIRQSKPGLIAEIGSEREVGELGELHLLCMNPAGRGGTLPTGTAPTVRAARWLIHFADREPVEVWFAPDADHGEVPAAHPGAVAAEPLPEVRTPVRNEVRKETAVRGCSTCRHRKRPGRSDPGYCGGGRDDLLAAYGLHHPLRKLPADEGASCASYRPHED